MKMIVKNKVIKNLPDGELNPGLPRDRRGYSPLYYRGLYTFILYFETIIIDCSHFIIAMNYLMHSEFITHINFYTTFRL